MSSPVPIRIGFFGNPELSRRVLDDILNTPEYEVVFVVTGEDKPVGRHQVMTPSPVKSLAVENNIPLLQPHRIRGSMECIEKIRSYEADYFVVIAYGLILPKELLDIPKKHPINIHGSLLPKYRGASPLQAALIAGEKETGMTCIVMNEKMDEGDCIDTEIIPIDPDETTGTLFEKFAQVSGRFVMETIQKLEKQYIFPKPQSSDGISYCTKITKEAGLLSWERSSEELYHLFQGLTPWPGVYSWYQEKRLIIEKCFYDNTTDSTMKIGTVIQKEKNIGVVCGGGILILLQVKGEGKKSQSIQDFCNGHQDFIGSIL